MVLRAQTKRMDVGHVTESSYDTNIRANSWCGLLGIWLEYCEPPPELQNASMCLWSTHISPVKRGLATWVSGITFHQEIGVKRHFESPSAFPPKHVEKTERTFVWCIFVNLFNSFSTLRNRMIVAISPSSSPNRDHTMGYEEVLVWQIYQRLTDLNVGGAVPSRHLEG